MTVAFLPSIITCHKISRRGVFLYKSRRTGMGKGAQNLVTLSRPGTSNITLAVFICLLTGPSCPLPFGGEPRLCRNPARFAKSLSRRIRFK